MPTFNRKVRVVLDWTLALFFRRDVVSLGQIQHPRREWEAVARDARLATGATLLGADAPRLARAASA